MLMGLLRGLWARWSISSSKAIPEPKKARLAYLTIPEPRVLLLNLQFEDQLLRVQISKEQLGGIVILGARELLSTGGWR
jgi:hypothetical protein